MVVVLRRLNIFNTCIYRVVLERYVNCFQDILNCGIYSLHIILL